MKPTRAIILFSVGLAFLCQCSGGKNSFSLNRKNRNASIDNCFQLSKKKKHQDAIRCFEAYRSSNRGSAVAAIADLAIADSYFADKEYLSSAEMYNIFIQSHPFHQKISYAYLQMSKSYVNASPKTIDRDQSLLDKALTAAEAVVFYYKNSPEYKEAAKVYKNIKERKAKKEFYVGRYYFKRRQYLAAIPRFTTIVNQYIDAGLENETFYYLILALSKTNQTDIAKGYFDAYKKFFPDRDNEIRRMAKIVDG